MKELTKAEEQIMQILWQLEQGFVKDILEKFPENDKKPKYTTVATVMKVLEKKGFVSYKVYGNTYQYYPLVTQENYSNFTVNKVVKNYFDGSLKRLVSFFVKKNEVDMQELDEIMKLIEKNKDQKS